MENLKMLVLELCKYSEELPWLEFKHNNYDPEIIGEDISALANGAALDEKSCAYFLWGIDNDTHQPVGTEYNLQNLKKGNEELENWLRRMLSKNAFESGILFRTELLEAGQTDELIRQLIRNQWRKICYDSGSRHVSLFMGVLNLDHYFQTEDGIPGDEYSLSEENNWGGKNKIFLDRLIENPAIDFDIPGTGRTRERIAGNIVELFHDLKSQLALLHPVKPDPPKRKKRRGSFRLKVSRNAI